MCVCVVSIAKCKDSLVRFERRAATKLFRTRPKRYIKTLRGCKWSCIRDVDCAGFNWIRKDAGSNIRPSCRQYKRVVGETTFALMLDLYVRETCEPGMYRVRQIKVGLIPCLFC